MLDSELKKMKDERETHSPVGCSYLPVAGVSNVTETDMLGVQSMGSWCKVLSFCEMWISGWMDGKDC